MRTIVATFILGLGLLVVACNSSNSTASVRPLTEVGRAQKKLSDLNATQIHVTKKLIETRNLLLSTPQDSPPTREISRQLAILNKQAGDLFSEVFAAELALEAAKKVVVDRLVAAKKSKESSKSTAADTNATANTETNAPNSSVSGPDVPALPGVRPEPINP